MRPNHEWLGGTTDLLCSPMPMEFDPIAQLAQPGYAAALAFIVIATLGFLAYRLPVGWTERGEKIYLRVIGFVAEILVAVGIIGLITFAGRAKLDSNELERAEATRNAEIAVFDNFHKLALEYCIPSSGSKTPTAENGAIQSACALWREYGAREGLDWKRAQEEFESIASRPSVSARLAARLRLTVESIGTLRDARHQQGLAPLERRIVYRGVSWLFIFLIRNLPQQAHAMSQ